MHTIYQHRQFSSTAIISFATITALQIVLFWLFPVGPRPMALAVFATTFALVTAVHYVTFSLTVEISENELTWYFASGFWRTHIALSDIASVTPVRLPWWYGIGIKYTLHARIYLVVPGDGIELMLINGAVIRIGTDDVCTLTTTLTRVLHL